MKIFALIPRNFNLSKKLTTLMFAIFLLGIIVSSIFYYNILRSNTEHELNRQANVLISTMDSIRKYNQDKVNPLLEKQSEQKLLLESIPSYAVSEVFNILTNSYKDKYGEYSYKDAMINPTNSNDLATEEEIKIIERLSEQDKLGGQNIAQGFLTIDGKKKFYTSRPIKITQSSCLICHTSLEKSPKSLQILYEQGKYGANQGFGWELNKIIGTKMIYIPAEQVYKITNENFILIIGIFTAIFAVTIFLATLWLKQYVVQPLNQITQVAEAVSLGEMDIEFKKHSNDEIGHLADAFTRMKTSLEIALKRLVKKVDRNQNQL
ncbi:c-type heme family protein [Nostoc sp. CCY 9925]|uniref:c-type heme family protein n=1 Tax=Nostoc sp. CCY 9925 TaxID=3103865 RepID=UPI0039C5E9ED